MTRIRHFRWWIALLLACATAINYLDRQTFPTLAATAIKNEIELPDGAIHNLNSYFLLGYGLMYAVGGWIMDRLGTRAGYALMIVWWSASNFAMGTVATFTGLAVFRLLLGLGEGGGFPGSAKAVSEWIPPKERSFAFGIFNTGSALGAIAAVGLISQIAQRLNWRWAFFITGSFGFAWVALWLLVYDVPSRSRFVTADECGFIESELASSQSAVQSEPRISWLQLFRYRELWGVMAAKFASDAAFYFYALGLPTYLATVRGLDIKQIGYFAWIPWVFAGAGSFAGGWFSGWLFRRMSLDHARKIALGLSAALMPVTLLVASSPLNTAIVFFGIAYFGHQFFSTIMQTLPADLFPSRVVGSVAGLVGAAGSFGGMCFAQIVGKIVDASGARGYTTVFAIAGLLHPLAFILILVLVRRVRRLV